MTVSDSYFSQSFSRNSMNLRARKSACYPVLESDSRTPSFLFVS